MNTARTAAQAAAQAVVHRRFGRQYGVITRSQALAAGMTADQVSRAVATGRWQRLHPGVYRLAGHPQDPHATLLAACLATGGVASHQSAAWLWGLTTNPPRVPTVSVGPTTWSRRPGVVARRIGDLPSTPRASRRAIPCTSPARTMVDLAAVAGADEIDRAIDVGLATRLFTLNRLVDEVERHSRRGRSGVGALRSALARRGHIGAPHPSVLESRVLRLLARGGIQPLGVEIAIDGRHGRYRLDITLTDRLAMEVDGFVYHADVHAMTRDHRRRNDLAGRGWTVLVFTWLDVTADGERVLRTVHDMLDRPRGARRAL